VAPNFCTRITKKWPLKSARDRLAVLSQFGCPEFLSLVPPSLEITWWGPPRWDLCRTWIPQHEALYSRRFIISVVQSYMKVCWKPWSRTRMPFSTSPSAWTCCSASPSGPCLHTSGKTGFSRRSPAKRRTRHPATFSSTTSSCSHHGLRPGRHHLHEDALHVPHDQSRQGGRPRSCDKEGYVSLRLLPPAVQHATLLCNTLPRSGADPEVRCHVVFAISASGGNSADQFSKRCQRDAVQVLQKEGPFELLAQMFLHVIHDSSCKTARSACAETMYILDCIAVLLY
jgi:hypothetical protein